MNMTWTCGEPKMKQDTTQPVEQKNQSVIVFIHALLVCLLLTLMVYAVVQFGEYVLPSWNGVYLLWVGLFVAIEAQYSQRFIGKQLEFQEKIFYRLAEIIVLIIGTRLLLYILNGFDSFVNDLRLWQENFMINFFTGEFLFALVIIFLVWGLATFLSSQLYHLEGDQDLLEIERESRMAVFRKEVRDSLAITILLIGIFMTAGATFILLNERTKGIETSGFPFKMLHVIAFFILGLVLLSLTQFSILRVRWFLDRVPVQNNLTLRWVLFSLGLLLIVAFISFILPTGYSINALEFLSVVLSIILWVLWAFAFILTFPIIYLLSLIFRLLGKDESQVEGLQNFVPKMPEQPESSNVGWGEWVKSLIFWTIFLLVVIFSIIYLLRQNKNLMEKLHAIRLFGMIRWFLISLKNFFQGAGVKVREIIVEQRQRLQNRNQRTSGRFFNFINPHRLHPRDKVVFYYLAMIRRAQENGISRLPSQTPYEYEKVLDKTIPDGSQDFNSITQSFIDARYSLNPIDNEKATLVEKNWERIKNMLRNRSKGSDA
jgi:hypothetical protein